jgi:hypothetical protein
MQDITARVFEPVSEAGHYMESVLGPVSEAGHNMEGV